MLKVIIADDEERICNLIRLLPNWSALGMEVVGMAGNGLEALELIHAKAPDVLITDIRMPGCQGLELIERALQTEPNLEIVIVSGYAHFEYAQTAIKLGVGDYLLKPIKKDELTATLQKLGDRCRARESAEAGRTSAEPDGRAQSILWEKLIADAQSGRDFPPDSAALWESYHFGLKGCVYQAFALRTDFQPAQLGREPLEIIGAKLRELLQPLQTATDAQCAVALDECQAAGVIACPLAARDSFRRTLRHLLNQLDAQKSLFGSVEFSLALTDARSDIPAIPSLVRQAAQLVDERLIEGSGRLLEGKVTLSGLSGAKLVERYGHEVETAVSTLDTPLLVERTNQLAHEAMNFAGVRGCELKELALSMCSLFALRLGLPREEEKSFQQEAAHAGRADELFEALIRFEKKHMDAEDVRRRSEALRPIRVAKQYIQENYQKPITLEDVCGATGFSVSYFSALFKKESGEGFSKYLTSVRMERAKELLQESNESVADICASVGYSDMKHFSQTFKKYANLTPAQYRKLYG